MSSKGVKAGPHSRKRPESARGAERPSPPPGELPRAEVESRHGAAMTRRRARGFSQGELTAAGMTAPLASGWGANVDVRRRSVIAANVQALRKWASSPSQEPKKEAMAKKIVEEVEEEVEKVEEEVKKESVKVKRKAAKAEKAVAKVEKEVVEKAEEVGKGAKSRAKKRAPKKKKVE